MKRYFIVGFAVVGVVGLVGLFVGVLGEEEGSRGWEYFRDMAQTGDEEHGVSYEAFDTNKNFTNNQTAQNPIPNTIPRGSYQEHSWEPLGTPIYEKHKRRDTINQSGIYALRAEDIITANEHAEHANATIKNPLPPTPENIERGKRLHNTFCYPCHGLGNTKEQGPIASYVGFGTAQPLSTYAYEEGRFYYTITAGRNAMPSYAAQISPEDRWKIVHYIVHELQKKGPK